MNLRKLKDEFKKEVKLIKRDGINDLLEYLESTDFFSAPASTKFHSAFEGGLVMHSLNTLDAMEKINDMIDNSFPDETLRVCALLHDVCKANFYAKEKRNKKIDGSWHEVEVWTVKDQLPMGHGEKSIYILQQYIHLEEGEALAIRWHLGAFDPGVLFHFPSGAPYQQAMIKNPLVSMLIAADIIASYQFDEWEKED